MGSKPWGNALAFTCGAAVAVLVGVAVGLDWFNFFVGGTLLVLAAFAAGFFVGKNMAVSARGTAPYNVVEVYRSADGLTSVYCDNTGRMYRKYRYPAQEDSVRRNLGPVSQLWWRSRAQHAWAVQNRQNSPSR